MDEELNLDNILDTGEIENLFSEDEDLQETPEDTVEENPENKEKIKENKEKEATEEINADNIFDDSPESVGSGIDNDIEGKEDTTSKDSGTSPNFYSSIANALREEGIFPDLNDDDFSKIKKPEDFRDLIDQQIKAGLNERQRRIDEALNYGIEPTEIKKYENTLNYLNSVDDDSINDESDDGEKLRKNLIYQDFINRGYSKERATREVQKSFNSGTDIEDAMEALKSNKDFFNKKYKDLVDEAKDNSEKEEQARQKALEDLKTSILNDKDVFGDLSVDRTTRQKIYDNITKPVYKDPDTGNYYTAIQKYEKDNSVEFIKKVGLIYTLTNGFKNLDGLVKNKVKKEVRRGLRELENTLNNTSRTSDGNLKYVSGVDEDPESFISKGWKLDV